MNTLFLVQFACCIIVSMLGLILVLSRFQIRWSNRRYEVSRWLLAFSMFVLAGHYVLQMLYGFRAKGDEIGAVVNVLFYSPISFIVSYAAYNLICYRSGRKKFVLMGCVSYALILICFFFGYNDAPRGMHLGEWLYVMLALFAVTIMYSVYTTVIEMRYHRKIIEENTAEDLLPFDRYAYASYGLAGIMVLAMVGAICYRPLLYCVAPLMLFMPMLSVKLGIPRNELSLYFENYLKSSFRIWLSDIRFKEAQRMLLEECRYSNDTISTECGFSSHAHLYKIFKAKTGFTPGQWRNSVRKKR